MTRSTILPFVLFGLFAVSVRSAEFDAAKLEKIPARMQQFVDPPPQKVVYLDGQPDAQVAQNAEPRQERRGMPAVPAPPERNGK